MLECRYNGNCCVMYHRPFDSDDLPCDGFDEDICSLYETMPDVESLLALADEMDAVKGFEPPYKPHTYPSRFVRVELLHGYASRIREALGVER